MNRLSLISLLLEIGYCSITLSNHDAIRLVRFILQIKVEFVNFVSNLHLIFIISIQRLM
jgi:hypothetical protein